MVLIARVIEFPIHEWQSLSLSRSINIVIVKIEYVIKTVHAIDELTKDRWKSYPKASVKREGHSNHVRGGFRW